MGVLVTATKSIIEKKQPIAGVYKTVGAALAGHGHSVLVGMCQGFSAILLPQLASPNSDLGSISADQASWIAALGVISNPVGALLGGVLADLTGRRAALLAAALPYLAGWLLIALAPSIAMLAAGRLVTGLAVGMGSVSYVYVAEVSGVSQRGTLAGCGPVLVSLGVLAVYAPGAVLPWRQVALLGAGVSLLAALALLALPESPPWLASRARHGEALAALQWLRCCSSQAAQRELDQMQGSKSQAEQLTWRQRLASALEPAVWKPFFILLVFFLFQEGSGIYVILFYAVDFFREVGSSMDHFAASITVAVARLVMSVLGAVLLGKFSRRSLAISSALGMTLAMCGASFYELLLGDVAVSLRPLAWLPALAIMLHVCLSMVGMLQLPWIMTGELFPLRVRSAACGLVTAAAHLLIFTSVKTYPALVSTLGTASTLLAFATASLGGAVFAYAVLPETKGKTLREIEREFTAAKPLPTSQSEIFIIDTPVKLKHVNINFHAV